MAAGYTIFGCIGVLLLVVVIAQPPPQGPAPGPNKCMISAQEALASCFQQAGFQMQYVIGLMTNGTSAPLPPNPTEMRTQLCGQKDALARCSFDVMNYLNESKICPLHAELQAVSGDIITLIGSVKTMCEDDKPGPPGCMPGLNRKMQECYTDVGLDPSFFTTNGSNGMQGAVIGDNRMIAGKYCGAREELFQCMREALDSCPGAKDVMAISGFDHNSLENAINVLCNDIDLYLAGLHCFQKPTTQVQKCMRIMVDEITELTKQQILQSLPTESFLQRFCQIRVSHLECDANAWVQECDKGAVGLKNNFECTLLPGRCQVDPTVQDVFERTCTPYTDTKTGGSTGNSGPYIAASTATMSFFTLLSILAL